MTASCDDIGGVPSWERCQSWVGNPIVEWPGGNFSPLFALAFGMGVGYLIWWLLGRSQMVIWVTMGVALIALAIFLLIGTLGTTAEVESRTPAHTWIVVPPDTIDCGVDDQTGPPGEWTSDAMRCAYDHLQDGTPAHMKSSFDDSNGGVGVARLYFDEWGTVFRIAIDGSDSVIVDETCADVTFFVEGGSIGFSALGCESRLANAETRTR